ncbi:hypothetical protein [Actinoplanes sp. N902-109]|uniref:hypothetical protein n=1 Tax=Actinoplanes sp. (strain N902-109) TaxID=649831 RepID=UPI0003295BC8|nr:hypothetical protein [Actinoplanes sp. N902-109]AGL17008.1 hypothetical protein L083_3498 [Actinoplanes sp. N902-109]
MSTITKEEITVKAAAAPPAAPPADLLEKAAPTRERLVQQVRAGLQGSLDRRLQARLEARRAGATLGEPTVGAYVAFDLYAYTPIQFFGPPPYQPSKIIAGGEYAVIYAVMFVNPEIDIPSGFAVQPTVQLGGRTYRVGMEQVNLTDVTDGPDDFRQDMFTSPADPFTVLDFWFQAPMPGRKPILFEANLSADIVDLGQPYAAFASTIIDADSWQVQENIPLRYLVYPK